MQSHSHLKESTNNALLVSVPISDGKYSIKHFPGAEKFESVPNWLINKLKTLP